MSSERPSRFERIALEVQDAESVQDALQVFQLAYGVDFATYHLALTIVDIVDTPYVRTTYSDAWVSRYLLRDYVKIDPFSARVSFGSCRSIGEKSISHQPPASSCSMRKTMASARTAILSRSSTNRGARCFR